MLVLLRRAEQHMSLIFNFDSVSSNELPEKRCLLDVINPAVAVETNVS